MPRTNSIALLFIIYMYGFTLTALAQPLYDDASVKKHREQMRINRETWNLIVNSSKDYRTVTNKCNRHGVQDIVKLMEKSQLEEFWAYLPKRCQWIEIGRDEKSEDGGATIRIDRNFLLQLMAQNLEIDIYHFHPKYFFNQLECHALVERSTESRNAQKEYCFRISMPGPEDIYLMMDTTWEYKQLNPSSKMTHKVISPNGVVEYSLTEDGERRYAMDRNLRTGGLYLKLIASNALSEGVDHLLTNSSLNKISISWLAEKLSGKYHRVIFFTFNEYYFVAVPTKN